MSANLELKALVEDVASTEQLIDASLALSVEALSQRDLYLPSKSHLIKLRYNNGSPSCIIKYQRAATPRGRPSLYDKIDVGDSQLGRRLFEALETVHSIGEVRKARKVFRFPDALINIDSVQEVGHFVEIEVPATDTPQVNSARLNHWALRLKINDHQIIPYSNIHMVNMVRQAALYKQTLTGCVSRGAFIAIDGASASGKTSLKDRLLNFSAPRFDYALRQTTRSPRAGDETSKDYSFISRDDFFETALRGDFAEFRDFEFGMSYGLPWRSFADSIVAGRNVLGLINLGNGPYLKRIWPDVVTVLLVASPEVIRTRLVDRGTLLPEQVEERVQNSILASGYAPGYDHVIDTGRVSVADAASFVLSLI